jgi:hypothetical protein
MTRAELIAELTAAMANVTEQPDMPIGHFIEAAVDLIIQGRATWDGENLVLIEGSKQ